MELNLAHQDKAPFIYPRLRVFLSVDLIGSTQFKLSRASQSPEWQLVLLGFYSEFQSKFFENWDQFTAKHENSNSTHTLAGPPRLWKALGDELIFAKECRSPREVCGIVQVWRKTLIDFKESWPHSDLRFKSGAWLVGTPVRNWEVAFLREPTHKEDEQYLGDPIAYNFHLLSHYYEDNSNRNIDIDFIGPSMDAGFRLLKHVDEQRLLLSADLAMVLAYEEGRWRSDFKKEPYPTITFYIDEPRALDGVTRPNLDYPIVWLSAYEGGTTPPEATYVDAVKVARKTQSTSIDAGKLQDLLELYLFEIEGFPEKPYICKPTKDGVSEVLWELPVGHKEFVEGIRSIYINAADRDDDLIDSLRSRSKAKKPNDELNRLLELMLDSIETKAKKD